MTKIPPLPIPSPDTAGKPAGGMSRRSLIVSASLMGGIAPAMAMTRSRNSGLDRQCFDFDGVFLDAAYTHPISRRTASVMEAYRHKRLTQVATAWTSDNARDAAVAQFAALTNVDAQDIAVVPSTMTGENMVLDALSIDRDHGVVTDALHYFGSLALYKQKAADGVPVTIVKARDYSIELTDIEAAITPRTRLISVSLVSGLNGFDHDLAALVQMAHKRGVLVYADCIQAAGAMPIDLAGSGVDFACCGAHKWLMGDFGAAFLYVRRDRLSVLHRRAVGWRQVREHATYWLPFDPPGEGESFVLKSGAQGLFEVGTPSHASLASLAASIEEVRRTGVGTLASRRWPLIDQLQRELPRYGLRCISPADNRSGIATFAYAGAAAKIDPALAARGIGAQVSTNRIRFSPSSYNTAAEIDRVIDCIKGAVK